MSDLPPYFMWFPNSYRWSSALLNIISTAPFGGADISEVYQIRRKLEDSDQEDDLAWFNACNEVARKVENNISPYSSDSSACVQVDTTFLLWELNSHSSSLTLLLLCVFFGGIHAFRWQLRSRYLVSW